MKYFLWPLLALLFIPTVYAADAEVTALKDKLRQDVPEMQIQSLKPVGDSGLYEAVIDDRIFYLTKDGDYLIQGNVLALASRENITQQRQLEIKQAVLARQPESDLIVFAPENPDYMLTVFTDVDCGYCRKLHEQIAEYNDQGIGIRYMAFPRAGADSESATKLEQVWCAEDRQQAMTDAKANRDINGKVCEDNPVLAQFDTGRRLGVEGTPALFLNNGQMLPGYVPPAKLREILDEYASLAP
ncbi:Thiol:disulfide interchange protein DsbC [Methylophaga frappieri]|uniref:Thiol:disulfide interchange protein n=1 Tax=Methylophaga frappieri (strain ATCC BAA-2434 / DSM 25690 / JAM7) TaxID=754477 RepID=I1YGA6_METFJ|nr:DsbC family protein [Methylophaga frappieri]AFJ01949.1 Thiol:disulfide interchange protein DsbC [Methylophaga frappieri]